MSKTLIAWEKGSGAGHLSRISKIARSIECLGQQVDLVIPSRHSNNPWFEEITSKALVVNPKNCSPSFLTGIESFASMLVMFGLTDKKYLMDQVKYWLDLFELKQTKNIVLDYSPIAQLVAYLIGMKAYQITDGFCAPTKDCPLFPSQVFYSINEQNNKKVIESINESISYVCRQINNHDEMDFQGYLNHPLKVYDTIPELDPYGQCNSSNSLGPLIDSNINQKLTFKDLGKPLKVFIYLRHNSIIGKEVLTYLFRNKISAVCVYPDATTFELQESKNSSIQMTRTPVDYNTVVKDCTHVMSYGATGTICSAVLMGKPQLQFPGDTQKKMVCAKLQALKTSVVIDSSTRAHTDIVVKEFLSNDTLLDNAKSFSECYKRPAFENNYKCFVEKILNE